MKFALVSGKRIKTSFQNRPLRPANLKRLNESVRTLGWLQPIVVVQTSDGLECIFGFHRRQVSDDTGIDVPCIVYQEGLAKSRIIEMQMTENSARAQMNIAERADNLRAYMRETGLNATAAGKALHMSASEVSQVLYCDEHLHADARFALANANIGHGTAYELAKASHDRQLELLADVVSGAVTREKLKSLVREPKPKKLTLKIPEPKTVEELIAHLNDRIIKVKTLNKQGVALELLLKALDF